MSTKAEDEEAGISDVESIASDDPDPDDAPAAVQDDIGRRWMITLNNYTEEEYEAMRLWNGVKYLIVGKEIAPTTGTPHLQAFFIADKPKRFAAMKKLNNRFSLQVPNGTDYINSMYCKKGAMDKRAFYKSKKPFGDGFDGFELGQLSGQGKRSDLDKFKDSVKAGITNHKILREKHSHTWARCEKFCRDYIADHKKITLKRNHQELYPWQVQVLEELLRGDEGMTPEEEHEFDRRVTFVYDPIGDSGKSWFCKKLLADYPGKAMILHVAKHNDLFKLVCDSLGSGPVNAIIFDVPREKVESASYGVFEMLKNGHFTSGKYQPEGCCQDDSPMLYVFSNEPPMVYHANGKTTMSIDRFRIMYVEDKTKRPSIHSIKDGFGTINVHETQPVSPMPMELDRRGKDKLYVSSYEDAARRETVMTQVRDLTAHCDDLRRQLREAHEKFEDESLKMRDLMNSVLSRLPPE